MNRPEDQQNQNRFSIGWLWPKFLAALDALTCLPVHAVTDRSGAGHTPGAAAAPGDAAQVAWLYPLIGGLIGLFAGLVFIAGTRIGLGLNTALVFAFLLPLMVTCARHERGFVLALHRIADPRAPATTDPALRLSSLLGLITIFALRWAALSELASELIAVAEDFEANVGYGAAVTIAFILAGAISRLVMLWLWFLLPPAEARPDEEATPLPVTVLGIACAITLGIALLLLSFKLLFILLFGLLLLVPLLARLAQRLWGGRSDELLNGSQLIIEVFVLLCLSAMAVPV